MLAVELLLMVEWMWMVKSTLLEVLLSMVQARWLWTLLLMVEWVWMVKSTLLLAALSIARVMWMPELI